MGNKPGLWVLWGVLGLAFIAGLVLALLRADLFHVIRPAMGLLMIAAGLFLTFGQVFVEPPVTDAQHALRRRIAGGGVGQVVFGIANLLPSGWESTACLFLAAAIIWASAFGFPARIFAAR
jgi:hypothetical protein